MDTCVGNSLGYSFYTGNLSVSPSKSTGKGGSYMERDTGICHYGTREGLRGWYFVWRTFNNRAIWNILPLTPFLSLVPCQIAKNLACPKSLLADAARIPQRSLRLVTLLCATAGYPFYKISLWDKGNWDQKNFHFPSVLCLTSKLLLQ